jgi:ATP-dependent DNA helicase PIF1
VQSTIVQAVVGPVLETLKRKFVLTASTGAAAVQLHGQTVHSFAGIGLGDKHVDELVSHIEQSPRILSRWRSTQTIVIDEISMISADLFDKLDQVARRVRTRLNDWFGGIQLIVSGDFLQLPPVSGKFAFEAKAWKAITHQVRLDRIYRQSDESFIRFVLRLHPSHSSLFSFINLTAASLSVLQELRVGKVSDAGAVAIASVSQKQFDTSDGIVPTLLHCKRADVQKENQSALDQLTGKAIAYEAVNDRLTDAEKDHAIAPQHLILKIGYVAYCVTAL